MSTRLPPTVNFLDIGLRALHRIGVGHATKDPLWHLVEPLAVSSEATCRTGCIQARYELTTRVDVDVYAEILGEFFATLGLRSATLPTHRRLLFLIIQSTLLERLRTVNPKLLAQLAKASRWGDFFQGYFTAYCHLLGRTHDINWRRPWHVARYAIGILRRPPSSEAKIEVTAVAIAALGKAFDQIGNKILCDVCFRHTVPGNRRCEFHLRSSPHQSADNQVRSFCRRAERVRAEFASTIDDASVQAHSDRTQEAALYLAAAKLVEAKSPDDQRRTRFHSNLLHAAIGRCPLAAAVAGENLLGMQYMDQVKALRQAFDPDDEMDATCWSMKIYEIEQCLAIEAALAAPKPRRDSPVEKVKEAAKALSAGTPCKTVALKLRVSRSTISKWKKRYPEDFRQPRPREGEVEAQCL